MENTVVGVYDSYAQAQNVMSELLACGFSANEVRLSPESDLRSAAADSDAGHSESGIGHFFRSLFGMEHEHHREHHDIYSEAVRRGSCVVTVDAADDQRRERAIEVMNRFDPVDIDERASQWRTEGWTSYDQAAPMFTDSEIEKDRALYAQNRTASDLGAATDLSTSGSTRDMSASGDLRGTEDMAGRKSMTGEQTRIPVVEEALDVGKRTVQRGGVRVFQRMTEKPVQESVQLREEHVNVERHAVDQPASEADLAAFKEGAMELRETKEEPVVSKTARVVEEVVVGKEVTERTENISDTVRRTDVDVEQLGRDSRADTMAQPAMPDRASMTEGSDMGLAAQAPTVAGTTYGDDYRDTAMTSDDSDYRTHWQNAYGQTGGRYEDFDAAYRYGSSMAGTDRYRNYRWEEAEPGLRSDWERDHPESAWEKVKDAVRYGAERVTGRQQGH